MADGGKKPSFWETIPGVITAIAGLITAVATLITALYTAKIIGQHEEPTKKEAGKEQGEANKQRKDVPAENQVERKTSVPEAAAKEPTEAKQLKQQGNTITDTASGLMWKRCAEGLSGVNCKKGDMEKYTWNDAVKRFKHIEYAGYSGWRIPTIDELKTLVYCSKGQDKNGNCNNGAEIPTISQQAFPNTEATQFWSGSPDTGNSDYAWNVSFSSGISDIYPRNYSYAVRLVRNGQ